MSGLSSKLVFDHRSSLPSTPPHDEQPLLQYQASMEEVADEESSARLTRKNTNAEVLMPRSSTFIEPVDEFPALSKWQRKSSLVQPQEAPAGTFTSRRHVNRLISYPSDSTMSVASTATEVGAAHHPQYSSAAWAESVTSAQSVSRQASIADISSQANDEEATASGQVTPSDLTPTPSIIAPSASWAPSYLSDRQPRIATTSTTSTDPPHPAPESTWGSDSGLGESYMSRISYPPSSANDPTFSRALWEKEKPRIHGRARTMTFDSSYSDDHYLQRSSTFGSSDTLNMSADDSELSSPRRDRMRRKRERGEPLGSTPLLTQEEADKAREDRPKSAFQERLQFWNKPDAQEIFPVPEGVQTRTPSPPTLQVRRALFDQPPMPVPDSELKNSLKRTSTWSTSGGIMRQSSSPDLSRAATMPPTSFAPPLQRVSTLPEPSKASRTSPSPPPDSPLSPPLEDIDDDEPPASDMGSRKSSIDLGHIPDRIPRDANSWGRKLGKFFSKGPISVFDAKKQQQGGLDDDIDTGMDEEEEKKSLRVAVTTPGAEPAFTKPIEPIPEEPEIAEEAASVTLNAPTEVSAPADELTEPEVEATLKEAEAPQIPTRSIAQISPGTQTVVTPITPTFRGFGLAAASGWKDYFNIPWIKDQSPTQAQAQGQSEAEAEKAAIASPSPTAEAATVSRDLASESVEFVEKKEEEEEPEKTPEQLAGTPPVWISERDVKGEAREEVKVEKEKPVEEDVKAASDVATAAVVEEEASVVEEETQTPGLLEPIPEEQHEEEAVAEEEDEEDEQVRNVGRDYTLNGLLLEPIMEEDEYEYESYDEEVPESTVADTDMASEMSGTIRTDAGSMRTLSESVRMQVGEVSDAASKASTRRRRRKTRKRKSLSGILDQAAEGSVGDAGSAGAEKKVEVGAAQGGEEEGRGVQGRFGVAMVEEGSAGAVVQMESAVVPEKEEEEEEEERGEARIEVARDLALEAREVEEVVTVQQQQRQLVPEAEVTRGSSISTTIYDEPQEQHHQIQEDEDAGQIRTAGTVPPDPPSEAAVAAPAAPVSSGSRLRRLMGKAIKTHKAELELPKSGDASPQSTPLGSAVPVVPSSPSEKAPKLSRKSKMPKLAKLTEELSLWKKATEKLGSSSPTSANTAPLTSQSEPSLISPMSSKMQRPGSSRRSTDYSSSDQNSPIEGPSSDSQRPKTPTRLPRLKRTMTEPAAAPTLASSDLPVRHYPAAADDSGSESRAPVPAQTIRLVDPDPEDAKRQPPPSPSRFGFRRTPSLSSLQELRPRSPLVSASTPALGYYPDNSVSTPSLAPSSSTSTSTSSRLSFGMFRSKTFGFGVDSGKKEKKEKKRKEKEKEKDKVKTSSLAQQDEVD
ncbi:hypothetical protein BDZ91DRAFT_535641 [Kalaharituber pfeilii]|nr:hypothetical protein BDZ91DRAFT_535641 [Kalaharituber pfeilii]